jgi:hypothetical protein
MVFDYMFYRCLYISIGFYRFLYVSTYLAPHFQAFFMFFPPSDFLVTDCFPSGWAETTQVHHFQTIIRQLTDLVDSTGVGPSTGDDDWDWSFPTVSGKS